MNRGVNSIAAILCFAGAGCQAVPQAVEVRSLPNPGAAIEDLGDARAQLALGNSGLALEGFRKVLRAQPDNPEAYAGIAKCYEAMGRFDLARKNYEAALAFAPKNPTLLSRFAVAAAAAQGVPVAAVQQSSVAAAPEPPAALVLQAPVPTASPAAPAHHAPTALAQQAPAPVVHVTAAAPPVPAPAPVKPQAVILSEVPAVEVTSESIATLSKSEDMQALAAAGPSITVALPPARPATPRAELLAARSRALAEALGPGPRLERMSPGEVALVTTGKPMWKATVVAQSRTSTTVRWIPMSRVASANIRVLNAARRQGLAAQSRALLLDRGWRKIEIGDALAIREESFVIYPESRRTLARSLAAQFGLTSLVRGKDDVLIVVLGRDAARRAAAQARG
jgi:hypothetical protein